MKLTKSQQSVMHSYRNGDRVSDIVMKGEKDGKLVFECVFDNERRLVHVGKRGKVEMARMHDIYQTNTEKSDAEKAAEVAGNLFTIRYFMCTPQKKAILEGFRSEEKQFFFDKVKELAERIENMPKTYEQDGLGDDAVAYLHYFKGGMDFYITEKDMEEQQFQAFGLSVIHESELGYVSIDELIHNDVELDFHFTPTKIGELKKWHSL